MLKKRNFRQRFIDFTKFICPAKFATPLMEKYTNLPRKVAHQRFNSRPRFVIGDLSLSNRKRSAPPLTAQTKLTSFTCQNLIKSRLSTRGQVTIFIIISILVIAGVVLFFVFIGGIEKEKPINPEIALIQNFVQECLDDSLEEVVFQVGENGGYFFPEKAFAKTPLLDVPYYIKDNKNLMPTKEQIQEEISKYVARDLVLCAGNFGSFSGYEITKGKIIAETIIEPERVLVEINYPLAIVKDEKKSKLEDFNSEVPVRFGIVYDAVEEFINKESTISDGTCVNCLAEMTKKDLYVSTFPLNDETTIFIVTDFNSEINKKEFVYVFANEK